MDLIGLIRVIKDVVPSKQERFNRSLVELYKALKHCHLAYEQLQSNPIQNPAKKLESIRTQ
ncbi:hypothetical protein [Vibrio parahaemolyticus]|uniref:hypothetical protein n=1 Tax=Vibrio parahaemolyticus TaxID=670 RepID=UPI001E5F2A6D|nr:hypothetical protein [Vibrio parahaemolyticus]